MTRSCLVLVAATFAGIAGCSSAPEIRIPQLEGARRAVEEPRGERTNVYQKCLQQALTPPPGNKAVLMQCMRDNGYGFLAKTAPHRVDHCRRMRETPGKFPEDFCFQSIN